MATEPHRHVNAASLSGVMLLCGSDGSERTRVCPSTYQLLKESHAIPCGASDTMHQPTPRPRKSSSLRSPDPGRVNQLHRLGVGSTNRGSPERLLAKTLSRILRRFTRREIPGSCMIRKKNPGNSAVTNLRRQPGLMLNRPRGKTHGKGIGKTKL